MTLTAATHFVLPDEKAYWFIETWQRTPQLGDRRVQRVWVLRGDAIVMHEEDMGPWDWEKDRPSQAPSLWEYSVAEVREITDIGRERKPPDDDEHLDLLTVWAKELDEQRMQMDHQSTFGTYFRKER